MTATSSSDDRARTHLFNVREAGIPVESFIQVLSRHNGEPHERQRFEINLANAELRSARGADEAYISVTHSWAKFNQARVTIAELVVTDLIFVSTRSTNHLMFTGWLSARPGLYSEPAETPGFGRTRETDQSPGAHRFSPPMRHHMPFDIPRPVTMTLVNPGGAPIVDQWDSWTA
jgi:hypothetical protein